MATNNLKPTSQTAQPLAQGLLSGVLGKAEHMIAIGCGGLLVSLLLCAAAIYILAYQF